MSEIDDAIAKHFANTKRSSPHRQLERTAQKNDLTADEKKLEIQKIVEYANNLGFPEAILILVRRYAHLAFFSSRPIGAITALNQLSILLQVRHPTKGATIPEPIGDEAIEESKRRLAGG